MSESGLSAGRPRALTPKRQGAKVSVGAKRPDTKTVRVQLHLGEKTVQRLGVHCSLVGANNSRIADEILSNWLARFGRGREIFPAPGPDDSPGEVDPSE